MVRSRDPGARVSDHGFRGDKLSNQRMSRARQHRRGRVDFEFAQNPRILRMSLRKAKLMKNTTTVAPARLV